MYPPMEQEMTEDLQMLQPEMAEEQALAPIPEEEVEIVEESETDPEQEEIYASLKELVEHFERKEQPVREKLLRSIRKCELFWNGIQDIIWDYEAKDFRSARDIIEHESESQLDPYYYNKIVNIFKGYGESVIAALTPETPTVVFPPDDADNMFDVNTSKGYTRISELLAKHNNANLLLTKAIFILWNQGLVGCYKYTKQDKAYGTVQQDKIENQPQPDIAYSCGVCGMPDLAPPDLNGVSACQSCGDFVEPIAEETVREVPTVVGYEDIPKSRIIMEIYGPKDFEIPHNIVDPAHTPYVNLKTECHYTYAQELYPDFADQIGPENDTENYGRWSREHPEYSGPEDEQVTIRRVWLRSWTFNHFRQDPRMDQLKTLYPEGVKVTLVNDIVVEAVPEELDKHWTFTQNPLSSHLHALPLGAPLIPIQEMRNELLLLKLQHVEYGIPETFADPSSLDFNTYRTGRATPGMVYPAKALPGKGLESSFTTLKTAAYPKEVNEFQLELDHDGQFVTGAFPTIYGGAISGGGKTAAEYNMSRNQAMQRLSTIWKFITTWYAQTMGKAVVLFHENMLEDEKYVQRNGDRHQTVWIRKADLQGRVGEVEPEIGDGFPTSMAQKKDLLMQILQLNNEYLNQALFNSENTSHVSTIIGFPEFYIPGQDDREKQLDEIYELMQGEPMDMEGMQPSIVPDILDNHFVELETCLGWMKSDIGRDAKVNNPAGFANVRAHAIMHQMAVAEQQAAEQEAENKDKEDGESDGGDNGNSGASDSQ
jgi:hypothetical protein